MAWLCCPVYCYSSGRSARGFSCLPSIMEMTGSPAGLWLQNPFAGDVRAKCSCGSYEAGQDQGMIPVLERWVGILKKKRKKKRCGIGVWLRFLIIPFPRVALVSFRAESSGCFCWFLRQQKVPTWTFGPSRRQAVYPHLAKPVDLRGFSLLNSWIYSLKPNLVNPDLRLPLSLSTELSLKGQIRQLIFYYFDPRSLDNLEWSGLESEYRDYGTFWGSFRPALPHSESFHR